MKLKINTANGPSYGKLRNAQKIIILGLSKNRFIQKTDINTFASIGENKLLTPHAADRPARRRQVNNVQCTAYGANDDERSAKL